MRRAAILTLSLLMLAAACVGAAGVAKSKHSNRLKPIRPSVKSAADSLKSKVLVTLDGTPYTLRDWETDLPLESRQAARTTADRVRLLEQVFEPRVLLLAAEKSGIASDSLTAVRLENARKQILINSYLEKIIRPLSTADSSEVRAYYDAHQEDYKLPESVTLRHIQVGTRKEADAARALLLKGEDFGALAKKISTDTGSKDDGGVIGSVTHDGFFRTLGQSVTLADTVMQQKLMEVGPPLEYKSAWHLFRVETREPARTQPFETVRESIRGRLEREKAGMAYRDHLAAMKAKYGYRMNMPVVGDSTLFEPTPQELFQQAQMAQDPNQRLRMYQDLLSLYPSSPFCAQAQFMIGFVYSEELQDYDSAEREFKTLLARYPQSELVKSAQWMIDNMRKGTPDFELPDSLKTQGGGQGTPKAPANSTPPKGNSR